MYGLFRIARNSLILAVLLPLVVSIFGCGNEDDTIGPDGLGAIPARVGIVMAPNLPTDEITSARLTITADDIEPPPMRGLFVFVVSAYTTTPGKPGELTVMFSPYVE